MPPPLVLASASPQRRAILERLGLAFSVCPADVEELVSGEPAMVAVENARRKARAVATGEAGRVVLGADTVVALEGRIFPKPRDEAQAREWLTALSGRAHEVVGGICVVHGVSEAIAHATTLVRFRALPAGTVEWYLATGEWRDRAGGYAIQGCGAALVEGIEGDYSNVVGLPVATLLDLVPGLLGPPASPRP